MKELLKNARTEKNLLVREVANLIGIDASLVSRFEAGTRKPTKEQVIKLAEALDLDTRTLLIEWMSDAILYDFGMDELALEALRVAESKIEYGIKNKVSNSSIIQEVLDQIDLCKQKLDKLRDLDSYRIAQALEMEYTYESNRIEGNTLTLRETDLVVNEGITISGKSMREHLEAINHKEAIDYLKELVQKKTDFTERDLLQLHYLILKGIDPKNAGVYRNVQVMIQGSRHMPPQPFLVKKQMEELFYWYEANKKALHPVILAAEFSERLVTIHPFIDGNGRTSRLMMNLILLRNGYPIANIKGDNKNRLSYYESLEKAQVDNDKEAFHLFVAHTELNDLNRYTQILGV